MSTKIEWTHMPGFKGESWNPVTGCTKVSAGCKNCYAERHAGRFWGKRAFTDVQLHPERIDTMLRWKKPRSVFVNSMSDLFHDDVPEGFIRLVFAAMGNRLNHRFTVLTKRPGRMCRMLRKWNEDGWLMRQSGWTILPNVLLGVSVEDQKTAEDRIPWLLDTPAAIRFLSCEPLLGPLDLDRLTLKAEEPPHGPWVGLNSLTGHVMGPDDYRDETINWVIVGGESGPKARPVNPKWVKDVRDQCAGVGVPFFFKQWGEWAPDCLCLENLQPCRMIDRPEPGLPGGVMFRCGKKRAGSMLDGRRWNQFPEGIR